MLENFTIVISALRVIPIPSKISPCADIAQLVEQRIRNAKVVGSTPIIGTIKSSSYKHTYSLKLSGFRLAYLFSILYLLISFLSLERYLLILLGVVVPTCLDLSCPWGEWKSPYCVLKNLIIEKLHWDNQVQLDTLTCICLLESGRDILFLLPAVCLAYQIVAGINVSERSVSVGSATPHFISLSLIEEQL